MRRKRAAVGAVLVVALALGGLFFACAERSAEAPPAPEMVTKSAPGGGEGAAANQAAPAKIVIGDLRQEAQNDNFRAPAEDAPAAAPEPEPMPVTSTVAPATPAAIPVMKPQAQRGPIGGKLGGEAEGFGRIHGTGGIDAGGDAGGQGWQATTGEAFDQKVLPLGRTSAREDNLRGLDGLEDLLEADAPPPPPPRPVQLAQAERIVITEKLDKAPERDATKSSGQFKEYGYLEEQEESRRGEGERRSRAAKKAAVERKVKAKRGKYEFERLKNLEADEAPDDSEEEKADERSVDVDVDGEPDDDDRSVAGLVDGKRADRLKDVGIHKALGSKLAKGRFTLALTDEDGRDVDLPEDRLRWVKPFQFMPHMAYFENTYLGGNAAYAERMRRLDESFSEGSRPYALARLPKQGFDPPIDAGLALDVALDQRGFDKPGRVFLQVGLQGSRRFGWRRPPLDVALVVDRPVLEGGTEALLETATALTRRLGPQDRLAVFLAGAQPVELTPPSPLRDLRLSLGRQIETLEPPPAGGAGDLAAAMAAAGAALQRAAGDQARIPGTQTVLLLTRGGDDGRIGLASQAAHGLTVQGAVTSVIALDDTRGWWSTASAGHGNFHRAVEGQIAATVEEELSSISKVIARLLRINVRLAPHVEAIRIVGSRLLEQTEVAQVKAREEATDRNLSKTLGVAADRGDDDDGLQTVIPYFYGGDAHVILIELWVEKPGPVADVSLKYKDMVELTNATARASAELSSVPRPPTPAERMVRRNVRGFKLAEALDQAAASAAAADARGALQALAQADTLAAGTDRRLVAGLRTLVQERGAGPLTAEALRIARERRLGHSE
ncbi:MAG: hypothetical protein KC620_10680 [Myxococcales bacterium]|nr:hypothetical protein [Myxococcales bacterium]